MVETSYAVIIPCRNGEKTVKETLLSLLGQTIQPKQIIVIDDASTDSTGHILKVYKAFYKNQISVLTLRHNHPRNFNRVPKLINLGISKLENPVQYLMLSGDDSVYPENYVETLITRLNENPQLKIVSGNIKQLKINSEAPQGSGRIFELEWLKKHLPFPVSCSWESGIMFKALADGMQIKCFNDLKFNHIRQYTSYSCRTFGHAMYCLGYFPLFVLFRLAKSFTLADVPRKYIPYQFLGYIEYCLASPEKQDALAANVRRQQKERMLDLARRMTSLQSWRRFVKRHLK